MSYQIDILPQEQKILQQFLGIALGGDSYLHPYIDDYPCEKEIAQLQISLHRYLSED